MIDPFTALAAVKSAVAAGKELVNVTKQIGEFFDGVDDLRAAHEKKKNSLFSGSDENAMETFVNLQRAKDAEEELRPCFARMITIVIPSIIVITIAAPP